MAKAKQTAPSAETTEDKPNLSVVDGKEKGSSGKKVDGKKLMDAYEKAAKKEADAKKKAEEAAVEKSDSIEAIYNALVEAGHSGKKFRDPNTGEVLTIMRKEWSKTGTVRWMFRGKTKDEEIPEL